MIAAARSNVRPMDPEVQSTTIGIRV
jgi:hypothetical protein